MYKIMIVEDDVTLNKEIVKTLKKWKYNVVDNVNYEDVAKCFVEEKPNLILIDVNLPYYDGFYWCKKIREISEVPIIIMSSRDTNMDILMGLNNGSDDYIVKPFSQEVLSGKVQSTLRRAYQYRAENDDVLQFKEILLKLSENTIYIKDEKIEITKNEMKILSTLIKKNGGIVTRDELMTSLWNESEFVNDNALTVNINRLRRKLSEITLEKEIIKTKKGEGYYISL